MVRIEISNEQQKRLLNGLDDAVATLVEIGDFITMQTDTDLTLAYLKDLTELRTCLLFSLQEVLNDGEQIPDICRG